MNHPWRDDKYVKMLLKIPRGGVLTGTLGAD
jgi:hypothetical protein